MQSAVVENSEKTPTRKVNLGFDLFRFWGVFCIFIGHNYLFLQMAAAAAERSEVLKGPNFLANFAYPNILYEIVLTGVPLFIMIAGYHALGRPVRANDWTKAKSDFVKYWLFWFKWLIVGLILLLLLPNVYGTYLGTELWPADMTIAQTIEYVLENLFDLSAITSGFRTITAINWTVLGLGWAALLCFLLRPVYQSKNIKAIRAITFIVFFMVSVVPTIYTLGQDMLVQYPDSLVALFFSKFQPLATTGWNAANWNNFWFPMLMLGGWYAVDTKFRDRVRSLRWPTILLIAAGLFFIFGFIAYYYGMDRWMDDMHLTIYWRCGWFPASAAWFIIADKLNATIKDESKLGKFTLKWAKDNIGGMVVSWVFGTIIQGNVLFFVYPWMAATFSSPFVLTVAFFLYNAAFYAVLIIIIHFLRPVLSKVPVLKGLLFWDKITFFERREARRQEAALAKKN